MKYANLLIEILVGAFILLIIIGMLRRIWMSIRKDLWQTTKAKIIDEKESAVSISGSGKVRNTATIVYVLEYYAEGKRYEKVVEARQINPYGLPMDEIDIRYLKTNPGFFR